MISDNIKRLRENMGLSQAALARKLGVTRASVNAWEMELSSPTAVYLVEMAQLFHTTTDDILGLEREEKISLRGMNEQLNIPQCIKNYGTDSYPTENGFVPENVFLERLPEIAKNAIADACTGSNPRQPSQEEMEKLLKCCYYDTEVDF